jgi:Tol biopolymer transport system component
LPTYSPDGEKLAYVSNRVGANPREYAIYVFDFQKQVVVRVYVSPELPPLYLFWLPDSKNLSFIVKEPEALSLMMVQTSEPGPARIINTGVPFYFDWNQLGDELALHISSIYDHIEQVALVSLNSKDSKLKKVITKGSLPFRAPAWSPNHQRLAYLAYDNGKLMLTVANADGNIAKPLVVLPPQGENVFVWAPDSSHIAYSSSPIRGMPLFGGIRLVDVVNNTVRKMTAETVMAYYFSPDGKQIAFVAAPPNQTYSSWEVVEIDSAITRHLCDFNPTYEDVKSYDYFDQYALSHEIWSPDSRAIVYAGMPAASAPNSGDPGAVWRLPMAAGSAAVKIGDGRLAFWSLARKN